MRRAAIKMTFLVAICMVASLIVLTYVALELSGVISVETLRSVNGETRQTHTWFVCRDQRIYLEAGNPDNPWVKDLEFSGMIKIEGEGIDGNYTFTVTNTLSDHKRIRGMMRSKYGWRDWWIALLFNTTESQLVEIRTISPPIPSLQRSPEC